MEKEKIMPGKFVAFSYRLYNEADGKLLFEATKQHPDTMIYGLTHEVIPGLVEALKGLSVGDKFQVTLKPEAAFGERFPENVITLDKEVFMKDGVMATEVTVGADIPMMTEEGYRVLGRVLEITDKSVKMDFNHPFAGMDVHYDGEVLEVRDATPEELQPRGGCGCGCGHDHNGCGDDCGCDHDHGCGDGCCH